MPSVLLEVRNIWSINPQVNCFSQVGPAAVVTSLTNAVIQRSKMPSAVFTGPCNIISGVRSKDPTLSVCPHCRKTLPG